MAVVINDIWVGIIKSDRVPVGCSKQFSAYHD